MKVCWRCWGQGRRGGLGLRCGLRFALGKRSETDENLMALSSQLIGRVIYDNADDGYARNVHIRTKERLCALTDESVPPR